MPARRPKGPDLEKYLEGKAHRYASYKEGAIMYSMPYWTFVNFAKEAGATWALRKTAMVDLVYCTNDIYHNDQLFSRLL